MSFMDILLKSNSTSVYDILKHQEKIEEIKKQVTVQDTIFQYLEKNRPKWERATMQEFGNVISDRRLNTIFNKVKEESSITQLDEHVAEGQFYWRTGHAPTPRPNISSKDKEGKLLIQSVLLKVSNALGKGKKDYDMHEKVTWDESTDEESKIILILRDLIDGGKTKTPARRKTDLEKIIGGNNGLIDRLRSRRESSVFGNARYMSRLRTAGIYHDKFLARLGRAITDENKSNTFHPAFWKTLNSGEPLGIQILRDFLHSQDATIPNTQRLKTLHRELLSGKLFNAPTKVKQLLEQKENPDNDIYDFSSEEIIKADVEKIMTYKETVVAKFRTAIDKFSDGDGGYTDTNHETKIHNKLKGKSNRQLTEIDFDEEFGNIVENDIVELERLREVIAEIKDALQFIEDKTKIKTDTSDINSLLDERIKIIQQIGNYDRYIESHEDLIERLEAGEYSNTAEEIRNRQASNALDDLKTEYVHVKLRMARLPQKGYSKRREQIESERNEERLDETKKGIKEALENSDEEDANEIYINTIKELEGMAEKELQGEELQGEEE